MIGEVFIEGTSYRLRYGMKAMRLIEEESGKSLSVLLPELKTNMSFTLLHLLVFAGLYEHHALGKDQVDTVIDECGFEACGAAVGKALESALPKPKPAPASAEGKARKTA